MNLLAIHRHPVKAMGGEVLDFVELDERGLIGDRGWAVVTADGKFASVKDSRRFRRHDEVFEYAATISSSGVFVTGHQGHWQAGDPALDEELSRRLGAPVRLQPEQDVSFFDSSPVSVVGTATLEWFRANGDIDADHRRLRANLLVETEEPFVEDSWTGADLRVGAVRLHVTRQITRCRFIDQAQNGLETTTEWLKALGTRAAQLAVYAEVLTPGLIRAGDRVDVLRSEHGPDSPREPDDGTER